MLGASVIFKQSVHANPPMLVMPMIVVSTVYNASQNINNNNQLSSSSFVDLSQVSFRDTDKIKELLYGKFSPFLDNITNNPKYKGNVLSIYVEGHWAKKAVAADSMQIQQADYMDRHINDFVNYVVTQIIYPNIYSLTDRYKKIYLCQRTTVILNPSLMIQNTNRFLHVIISPGRFYRLISDTQGGNNQEGYVCDEHIMGSGDIQPTVGQTTIAVN